MVDSLNSTRQSSPAYQLKRPVQEIPLDELLTTTAEDLLCSVVTTLQNHCQRYMSHLDQQKVLYSSYAKTMAKSQVQSISTKTVTKSCGKSATCKQPATFQGHSNQMDIDKALEQQALDTRKQASECFFTMVDSRVCTQTTVSLSRINSVVYYLSQPVISDVQRSALLDLAWSCLTFLWKHLRLVTDYPPVRLFLCESSEALAPVISGSTTTIDNLLALFDSDHYSIILLCHALQYNEQHHHMLIQRYQRITHLIMDVQRATLLEKLPSPSLSQYLPALEYLIGSFDINTWANSDAAVDETTRQAFYLAACDFIRQQDQWKQDYGDTVQDNNDGSISGIRSNHWNDNNNLVDMTISHMMTLMATYLRKQKETTQGEHLYVLHLLLDTLAAAHHSIKDIDTIPDIGLPKALDTFIEVLSQQDTKKMIVTQCQWEQQNRPNMRLEWLLLNDPNHMLDVLHTIGTQICTTTGKPPNNSLQAYGSSGCMSLARLIFSLLLDPRVGWDFTLLVRHFELFWKPSEDKVDGMNTGKPLEHNQDNLTTNHGTDAQLYITQLFGLSLELLLFGGQGSNTTLKSVLDALHCYFHQHLLYQLDDSWFYLLLLTFTNLPWGHLSPLCSHTMETMLTSCVLLRKTDQLKYRAYSGLVYSVLNHTIITSHQQQAATLNHYRLLQYVKLTFMILMVAEWIWPNEVTRIDNLERLWEPIIYVSGELKADDMAHVIEVTRINDPSNWKCSLGWQQKNGNSDAFGDHDSLAICVRWMRHLTLGMDTAGSMKLVAVFGGFILDHIGNVGDNIEVQMDWLKVLLDQADGYMAKHDTTLDFDDCIDWFALLLRTLLDEHHQQEIHASKAEILMDTICEAISTSDYSTTLAMFTACVPRKSISPSASPVLSASSSITATGSTASSKSPTHSAESLESVDFRLKIMECCLEHCLQLRNDEDVWLRVGGLLHDAYMDNKNEETTTRTMESSISEYIRHSMDLSIFLVLNAYCHAKLQQSYSVMDSENGTTNNDHHVAEEIAAILSMAQLGNGSAEMNVQQAKKRMVLVRLFAHLLSKNKGQKTLDLWLASIVSMARSCARWSTALESAPPKSHSSGKSQAYHTTMKEESSKYHDYGWTTCKALATVLECFLASRLAIIGIPPYSGMIPNDNSKAKSKMTPWITILEQRKKKNASHKDLFDFTCEVILDEDHWTLWKLDDFIFQIDDITLGFA
ncbi:hypothetical protein BCR42DRAFT_406037 [Absidia repens]|uniref:Uncharacterized protein n=1 Tax=Absidia repens TaxID=90262 RepID=A0A1X2IUB0_9FUNG|nr:hypothetical protein BCR42DRAFT_406037 [Absidia repens]